jgi:ATP-binding cassette, subfamily B, bacterial
LQHSQPKQPQPNRKFKTSILRYLGSPYPRRDLWIFLRDLLLNTRITLKFLAIRPRPYSALWSFLWPFIKQFRYPLLGMTLAAQMWPLKHLLQPYLLKRCLDISRNIPNIEQFSWSALEPILLLYLSLRLCTECGLAVGNYLLMQTAAHFRSEIRSRIFKQYLHGDFQKVTQSNANEMAANINLLPQQLDNIIQKLILSIFPLISSLIGTAILLILMLPSIAFILILSVGFHLLLASYILSNKQPLAGQHNHAVQQLSSKIYDSLRNIHSIKLFNGYNTEHQHLQTAQKIEIQAWKKLQQCHFQYTNTMTLIGFCQQQIWWGISFLACTWHWLSIEELAFSLLISSSIFSYVESLSLNFIQFHELCNRCQKTLEDIQHNLIASKTSTQQQRCKQPPTIAFNKVSFSYLGQSPLFDHLTLSIPYQQKVGIVGLSGSGKSSVLHLLLGLHSVDRGHISIGGQNIHSLNSAAISRIFSFIPQDPILFSRSIKENIQYAYPEASIDMIIAAAKKAHAHDFIMAKTEGYSSLIGNHGISLSGGEKQRLLLARAFLKPSSILILDEASSSLDAITESNLQQALTNLMQEKTTIVISHRLRGLQHLDRIIVFKQGKIIEDGSPMDLLKKKQEYASLWQLSNAP